MKTRSNHFQKIESIRQKLLSCDACYRISTGTLINHQSKSWFHHECNTCNNNKNQTTKRTSIRLIAYWKNNETKIELNFFDKSHATHRVMTFEFMWLMDCSFTCNKSPMSVIALQADFDCKSLSEHPWKFLYATDVV